MTRRLSRREALALGAALLLNAPRARAQERESPYHQAFAALMGSPATRRILDLPEARFWRLDWDLLIVPYADDPEQLQALLMGMAEDFAAPTRRTIDVAGFRPLADAPHYDGEPMVDIFRLDLIFGHRANLSDVAAELGIQPDFRRRFEIGHWPFLFHFERVKGRGWVLIAQDEPGAVFEAAIALGLIWAFGGATLGPELEGLVVPGGAGPEITETGKGVLALLFHPELKVGMPLEAAIEQARGLVRQ